MDSINNMTLKQFQCNDNIEIVYTPNQNETDFTKSIREIKNYSTRHNIEVNNLYLQFLLI